MSNVLLEVKHLKKNFPIKGGVFSKQTGAVKAVDDVSFSVQKGEVFGLVGESGCGKSTTGRTILRLIEPTSGEIYFAGQEITSLSEENMRRLRRDMQIVFQDPYASLNPRHNIEKILSEPLLVHGIGTQRERRERVFQLLETVGLSRYHASCYPHQFSGGQRQRIGIARALALNPKLIVADEPVSALDVSIQSQILNLMLDLKEKFGLTYIFIAHDLSVVKHISDRVGVMYLGRLIELADKDQLYDQPRHPYTQALLSAIPVVDLDHRRERVVLKGEQPNPTDPPAGCVFHTRCPECMEICQVEKPPFKAVEEGHFVACHLYS